MISRILLFTAIAVLSLAAGTNDGFANSRTTTRSAHSADIDDGPQQVASIALPSKLTPKSVEKVILRAAIGRKWKIIKKAPGCVVIHLVHRGYDSTLTFNYDDRRIKIISDSWVISRSGIKKKRKDPTGWIENLEKDIKAFIVREQYL